MGIVRARVASVIVLALLSGCGGGGGGAPPAPARSAPTAPAMTLARLNARPGEAIAMSAVSMDVANAVLTYTWAFGDGASGTGASVTHAYAAEGQFSPQVTVANDAGLSASTTSSSPVVVTYLPVPNFLIFPSNQEHFLGQTLALETSAVATDSNGLAITYLWSFGDGATATGPKVTHVYAAPGTYAVTLTVSNSAHHSSTAQTTAKVSLPSPPPAATDNQFAPYCSGPYCGAATAGSYAGPGVGIWRYRNANAADATVDIEIQGVHSGQIASLVFSNGTPADAASQANVGTFMPMLSPVAPESARDPPLVRAAAAPPGEPPPTLALSAASAHDLILQRNLDSAREFVRARALAPRPATSPSRARPLSVQAPPALGTARVWYETFGASTPYNMEVAATCALPSGRNAVFWLDSAQVASGAISAARIQFMVNGFCGADGAYARQIALTGDVWGPAAAGTGYIEDAPGALLDLHIVIPGVPTNTAWGGYFASSNLAPATAGSNVNGALAVFVNPFSLLQSADDKMAGATLIHELKHHINYYQRTVVRGAFHPQWLEETSAMLSEDLFTLPALGFNRAELRHDGYVFSGGGVGYLAWQYPDGQSYNQGGSFGAFLHRRYGLDVDRRLIDSCADSGSPVSGYQCLDALIARWGGHGFADEFDRLGASVFGGLARGSFPFGFGFPSIETEGVLLPTFSSESVIYPPAQITPRPITQLLATMHAYRLDTMAAGQTVYKRQGVVVPAGTTLLLVIQ